MCISYGNNQQQVTAIKSFTLHIVALQPVPLKCVLAQTRNSLCQTAEQAGPGVLTNDMHTIVYKIVVGRLSKN